MRGDDHRREAEEGRLRRGLLLEHVEGGATDLAWAALPTARAYFIAGMGAAAQDEMVIWTSSEVPEAGFGLIDYQTNAAVDRWLKEKVLLAPATTSICARRWVSLIARPPGKRS